jgi:hypothetical protein
MANKTGSQPEVKFCPSCKGELRNIPRSEMRSKGHIRKDGSVSEHTHTYECLNCNTRFEINQER